MLQKSSTQPTNLRLLWVTRRSFVISLLMIIGVAVLVFSFIIPQFNEALAKYADWQAAVKKEEQLQKKLQELSDKEVSPDFQYESIVNQALPDRKPLMELIQSLDSLSRETGVIIEQFTLEPGLVATQSAQAGASTAKDGALELEFTVSGTFSQLNDFMSRIEQVTPFTTLSKLGISGEITNFEEDQRFTARLSSQTYYFTKSVSAGVSSALPDLSPKSESILQELQKYAQITVPVQTEVIEGEDKPFGETYDPFAGE